MHKFRIWAPKASKMRVKCDDKVYPMQGPDAQGWWNAEVAIAASGTDYGFLIDEDETEYPDPRGLWQPEGVHGRSRLHGHEEFEWMDDTWQGPPFTGAVVYELHVGTFTPEGTFDAAVAKLPYLFDLGVTHVELMPVAAFPGAFGWGYDGVGLFAVQDAYGGPNGLKRFVNACHVQGIGVLLDVVYNHFGPVGSYANKFGPYLTDRHRTPWGDAVNFEGPGSDEVRQYFCDNALMWMRDYHVDGLRLDAIHEFMDRSAINFLEQLSAQVEVLSSTIGRRLVLIAESDLNDPRVVTPREAGGYGIDAQWSDDFHHALFTLLNTSDQGGYYSDFGKLSDLSKALTQMFVYDGEYSPYRNRRHGRAVQGLSAHHFVGYIQNHDQVGNRARGDRLHQITGMGLAKVAAGLVFTAPFVPMVFQGEEYAASSPFQYFADHEDPEMAKAVSAGRRAEFAAFGWKPEEVPDPEKAETFERSKLNWDEVHQGEHAEMLDWYRRLIHFRRKSPSLNDGDPLHVKVTVNEEERWLRMDRTRVRVAMNLAEVPREIANEGEFRLVLGSHEDVSVRGDRLILPPGSIAILCSEMD